MLRNTFVHLPGLGPAGERRLWAGGCLSWDDYRSGGHDPGVPDRDLFERTLDRSVAALDTGEHQFFRRHLGTVDAWRAFQDFRDRTVYLDIETDGGKSGSSITTIGLWDGREFVGLVRDRDLGNFPDIISHYSLIVTFFGASFDLPMIQRRFPTLRFDQLHLDLCPTLRQIGLKGGLKSIEKQVGIQRGDETDGLTGYDAVKLWRRYRNLRDEGALETLLAYNRDDVVNLETLAELAYSTLRARTFVT